MLCTRVHINLMSNAAALETIAANDNARALPVKGIELVASPTLRMHLALICNKRPARRQRSRFNSLAYSFRDGGK